ncbi:MULTISPECIES: hypothetical protein [unclassified Cohnella]|uniref:hypothetical protein n=1 Tax=unclassified Cohnella TaxID=2636738 RepID=UPI001E5C06D5|nr:MULTISPECIES: hypothetical protein [unclassified Cohnella]
MIKKTNSIVCSSTIDQVLPRAKQIIASDKINSEIRELQVEMNRKAKDKKGKRKELL